jgi:hypothetical protein
MPIDPHMLVRAIVWLLLIGVIVLPLDWMVD